MRITKRITFEAGHRVPDHESKCANPHGHGYVLEATVEGEVVHADGDPRNGMVIDFAEVKHALVATIDLPWDHAFLVYEGDTDLCEYLCSRGWKVDVLPVVPTVENLVRVAAMRLMTMLEPMGVHLVAVRMFETPTCWADWSRA